MTNVIVSNDIDTFMQSANKAEALTNLNAIGYVAQDLTDEQKAVARGNIGVSNNTITIAASNTTASKKVLADFVCDGSDDNITLQAAIDSAVSRNTTIQLEDGTYSLSAGLVFPRIDGLKFRGRGSQTILQPVWNSGAPIADLLKFDGLVGDYLEDIEVSNLSVITNAPYALVGAGGFIGVTWSRIWAQYCRNFRIENIFAKNVGFAVDLRICDNFTVNNVRAENAAGPLSLVSCDDFHLSNIDGKDVKVVVDQALCNRGTLTNISGTVSTVETTGSLTAGVEAGIILDSPIDLNFITVVENIIHNVDSGQSMRLSVAVLWEPQL